MPKKNEQIADDLRHQISSGELAPGDQLPTEIQLATLYRVSLGTVREALHTLRSEGLLDTRLGRGSFVRHARRRIVRRGERHQREHDRVPLPLEERQKTGAVEFDTGLDFVDIEFHATYRPEQASEELAELFGISAGTKMLHRAYVSSQRAVNAPVSLIRSWLVWDMVAGNPALLTDANEPWAGGTQHQLSTVGIELGRIVEEFTARPPQPEEMEMLNIDQGVSVLFLRKTSIDTTDRVVEYSEVVMPGDRTIAVYTTKLERWSQ